ncbi:hypothetical protein [Variovorax paradoxus]|jgi:hypothetical protein|uniref:hypothetical protein n=1 Tax=Variovorax paradoxus TaxID=34073 RepID=UPI001ABC3937
MNHTLPLPPPEGYANWLDYAVANFDTRDAWLESVFKTWIDDAAVELDRSEIRESLRIEVEELRAAAADRSRSNG